MNFTSGTMNLDDLSFRRIMDNLFDGVYFVDRHRVITYWNKAAERITGFRAEDVLGRPCADNILSHVDAAGNALCLRDCPLSECMKSGTSSEQDIYLHHKKGHRVAVAVRTTPLTNAAGEVIGGVELFSDISNRLVDEHRVRELEQLALLDSLTRLPNRNYMERDLQERLAAKRKDDRNFGVLFVDIDHFKSINDTWGHDTGDEVLVTVAETLGGNSRPYDLFGRWGGEEFVGVVPKVDVQDLELVGNRLRILVEHSFIMREHRRVAVTVSMGATLVKPEDSLDSALKRADELLYKAKEGGRNQLCRG